MNNKISNITNTTLVPLCVILQHFEAFPLLSRIMKRQSIKWLEAEYLVWLIRGHYKEKTK